MSESAKPKRPSRAIDGRLLRDENFGVSLRAQRLEADKTRDLVAIADSERFQRDFDRVFGGEVRK